MGKVVLVGAGPGNVELLTLEGKKQIQQADCIVYDRLASPDILEFAGKDCEFIFVGKENHHHTMKQEDINCLLAQKAKQYSLVVRLKGGDPYVFGRGGEEGMYLSRRGIEVEVISGVSSVVAALASAGIPITHRGVAKGFQVITAHSKKDMPSEIDYSQLMDETVTLVFLMGLAHVREIAQGLLDAGRNENTPVAVIEKGTTPKQRKVVGNLLNIDRLVQEADLASPAIIVVGDVVRLADELDFFETRPLFGKRVLIPYIEGFRFSFSGGVKGEWERSLTNMVKTRGADVTSVKVGRIQPLSVAIEIPDWIVFTSANGIHTFMWNLAQQGKDVRMLGQTKIAVVGRKTEQSLKTFGLCADLVPEVQTAVGLAEALKDKVKKEDRVTFFGATGSGREMEEILSGACEFSIQEIYTNEACVEDSAEEVKQGEKKQEFPESVYDATLFTSASTVHRLSARKKEGLGTVLSIGPSCSTALQEHRIINVQQAEKPSYESLLELLYQLDTF